MRRKELLPCLALFLGSPEALQGQCPSQTSFFGQRTIRALRQVAPEQGQGLRRILSSIEQEAREPDPRHRFFAGTGELLLQLTIELDGLRRISAAARVI